MATVPSTTLRLSNPLFSSALALSPIRPHAPSSLSFTTRATPEDSSSSDPPTPAEPDSFDNRLSEFRVRRRSGTGKKAEARKMRQKEAKPGDRIFLRPVPLKEPVSGGVKVEFGFKPFSEKVNGRLAMLGLTALLLVELATGKSVISYHSPPIVLLQLYFVAAVTAVYCKFEKEKDSVWPK